ncbi:MAG TPA: CPBP family intramembrane glutamic endopeptidase [Pirellulales bacterium]|jgi:hypothetical protein|nr:CPBP family intramembrane glutamic endopeptidase [Pirellulales bacterium]
MIEPPILHNRPRGALQTVGVWFALVYPALLTWFYFIGMNGQPAANQQAVFIVGKAIQFALPIYWLLFVERRRIHWKGPSRSGVIWGIASGLLIGGATLAIYFGWLLPSGSLATSAEVVRKKLFGMGLTSPAAIIEMSAFYSLVHSLLEEYYWRWFVFGRLREHSSRPAAIAISSIGFMAHHVILVFSYFPWPWAAAASVGVAIGGALWAWRYDRDGSLWGPWISHLLVDAAIFAIGFQMAFLARR